MGKESDVPQIISKEYKVQKEFTTGGSSAGTLLVTNSDDLQQVLKFSTWQGIGSSGTPWLKAQASRLIELKRELPYDGSLAIPAVYKTYEDEGLFYYTFEYFDGLPFSSVNYSDRNFCPGKLATGVSKILDLMTNNFYNQGKLDTPRSYVENVHLNRARNRLGLLTSRNSDVFNRFINGKSIIFDDGDSSDMGSFFGSLVRLRRIVVNGQVYPNPLDILKDLDKQEILDLTPSFIPRYSHGDGTLRNFLTSPSSDIKIIDVRGVDLPSNTVSRVCIPYELGKMMRTILLEVIRANDFLLYCQDSRQDLEFGLKLKENTNALSFVNARKDILNAFIDHRDLNALLKDEGDWVRKTLFAEAIHFLADAVNRLESDDKGKQTLAYFLLGTMLLANYRSNGGIPSTIKQLR